MPLLTELENLFCPGFYKDAAPPALGRAGFEYFLKFFRGREGQAAFAVEQLFQSPVAGTALAPDDFRRDKIAHFATKPPAFQPVFPTD